MAGCLNKFNSLKDNRNAFELNKNALLFYPRQLLFSL